MDLDIHLEKDLGIGPQEFDSLREMLASFFPDASSINENFLIKLTPDDLKNTYIKRAAACHPKTYEGLSESERKNRKEKYERLTYDYKELVPRINAIQKNVKRFASKVRGIPLTDEASQKVIIAIGGAKGGVGKSLLSANLAVGLGLLGQKVVVADLDFGGADLHLYLGVKALARNWNDFMEGRARALDDIMIRTPFKGVSLIGGDSSRLGTANLPYSQKLKIMRHLKALECDYVIIDLGGDTSYNVLDFFLMADQCIAITGAEPASVLDTYNFVKVAFHRLLDRFFAAHRSIKHLTKKIHEAYQEKKEGPDLEGILEEIQSIDQSYYLRLKQQIERFSLSIVLNMAEKRKDANIATSMQDLLKRKCSIDTGVLGTIPFDRAVRKASRRLTPFIIDDPHCRASKTLYKMLAGVLLLRKPREVRAQLIKKTRQIRSEVKDIIGKEPVTLDALTQKQISYIVDLSPDLRDGYRRVLNLMAN